MKIWPAIAAFIFACSPAVADEIVIRDFNWYGNDSYCSFLLPEQTFIFDDPTSWRFVFVTNLPVMDLENFPETPEEIAVAEMKSFAPAFMAIDGGFHELAFKSGSNDNGHLNIVYSTYGDKPYDVVLDAQAGKQGYEAQAYQGTITVRRDEVSASVKFKGDCGV